MMGKAVGRFGSTNYCCCFRNPVHSPVEGTVVCPIIYKKVIHPPSGAGFQPSTVVAVRKRTSASSLDFSWYY